MSLVTDNRQIIAAQRNDVMGHNQTHAVQQKELLDYRRRRVAGAAKARQGQAPSQFSY
jgi:hypothetical protein